MFELQANTGKSIFFTSLWFILSLSLTILNKAALAIMGFNFPILLSFFHMSFATFISFILTFFKGNQEIVEDEALEKREKGIFVKIIQFSLIHSANIIFGNISLSLCSVAFVQIVRSINPFITMILSHHFFNTEITIHHILSCTIVCVGVAIACFGEINLTAVGTIVVFIGVLLSSIKTIFIKHLQIMDYMIPSAELITRISPISAIETFCISFIMREPQSLISRSEKCFSWKLLIAICVCSTIAYFLNLSNFLATKYSSPLTMKIVGCVKQVTTIIISIFIFDKKVTWFNTVGIAITIIGSVYYSLIKQCTTNEKLESEKIEVELESSNEEEEEEEV